MIWICFYFSFFLRPMRHQVPSLPTLIWTFPLIYSFHKQFYFSSKHALIWMHVFYVWSHCKLLQFKNQLLEQDLIQSSCLTFQGGDPLLFITLQAFPRYQHQRNLQYFYHYRFRERHRISIVQEWRNVIGEECWIHLLHLIILPVVWLFFILVLFDSNLLWLGVFKHHLSFWVGQHTYH